MNHRLGAVLTAVTLASASVVPVISAPAASAAPAQHDVMMENYDAYEHLSADENFCGAWPATFHEVRSGAYRMVMPPGGRETGEVHLNGAIDGRIELVPDDSSLPTYSGDYREKLDGILIGADEHGDLLRVGQYRLRSTLTGSDGSVLRLALSGKVTMNANGVVVVSDDVFSCS